METVNGIQDNGKMEINTEEEYMNREIKEFKDNGLMDSFTE